MTLHEAIANTCSKYSRDQPVDWYHHVKQPTFSLHSQRINVTHMGVSYCVQKIN